MQLDNNGNNLDNKTLYYHTEHKIRLDQKPKTISASAKFFSN